jgi:DNA-binding transcriptional MerR regulator
MGLMKSRETHITEPSWGIRQFAEMFDVTPRTIRFYEDKGILSPKREAGTRIFGPTDRAQFERIMRAKRMGFTLDDIKAVLDVTNGLIDDRDELKRRRANFQSVIQGLGRRREDIDIMAKDMRNIVAIIDDHLENTEEEPSVQSLAAKYEAAFKKSFAHSDGGQGYSFDYQADDFAPSKTLIAE